MSDDTAPRGWPDAAPGFRADPDEEQDREGYASAYADPVDPSWDEEAEEPFDEVAWARARRTAELWRAVGLGLAAVWLVVLALVVLFWLRVTLRPRPGDVTGPLKLLLAAVALAAVVLLAWTLGSGWRLVRRRASGWDVFVVLGSLAVAVAVLLYVPARYSEIFPAAPLQPVLGLAGFGAVTVVLAMVAQRAFRRAAVGYEPSDDDEDY